MGTHSEVFVILACVFIGPQECKCDGQADRQTDGHVYDRSEIGATLSQVKQFEAFCIFRGENQ